jgi:type I restriction-modification system DNA methylase subunit
MFRKGVEAGTVDAMTALPAHLFFNTSIPAPVLVLRTKPRHGGKVVFVNVSARFTKFKKQSALAAQPLEAVEQAVTETTGSGAVRTEFDEFATITKAGSDLSVSRWLEQVAAASVAAPVAVGNG